MAYWARNARSKTKLAFHNASRAFHTLITFWPAAHLNGGYWAKTSKSLGMLSGKYS
eukprot:CAMPEP_0183480446 /NCGR_PEP_ID=MMETSP0370-20130417/173304_1 /TAXON_ID=268820 /ORGANISM="Peridinium aciculiferum, Strain PAER-2" /LENGTH=55 /DNA_ID=CAMNT_0025673529 /DNA_START=319 /DNA_END=483 /DNA_ORIENTATION=-